MRAVFGLVLIVGVALAGGAVMMARGYIEEHRLQLAKERQARAQIVPTQEVLVANTQLRYGAQLEPEHVRVVRWPVDAIPEGTFTKAENLFAAEAKDNRFVIRTMEKGEAIMAVKVTEIGEDAGLTSRLERGMRAFAVKVDVTSGVSGFLRPGDRVDVYWTGGTGGAIEGESGEVTRLIQTNIQLIAIDQSAGNERNGASIARTVTVAARPEQIAILAQGQNTGKLTLALVGATDDTVASTVEVNKRALLGLGDREAAPEVQQKKVCTIRNRRGAEVIEIPIPCTN
ncbi:Flp pilus assembly protein CpaB [Ruegeria jejuensis]|uniref:Flp pilus assembly protein CpaB n=1 Tax=Ruegeria jejuensis TaxID=3233338 RepID=UPI00355C813B